MILDPPAGPRLRAARAAMTASLAASLLAACAAPADRESFFALSDGGVVLASASQARVAHAATAPPLPGIVVSAVGVPELVDRPQIVTRDSANRVVVSEQNLWAESVKSGIGRTLAMRLSRALDDAGRPAQVAAYPESSVADPVLRVTVDIVRFDAVPNGEAVVDALWSVRRPADNRVWTGRAVASSPIAGTSYAAIVGAWNDAVSSVDREIASAVTGIVIAEPVPTPAR